MYMSQLFSLSHQVSVHEIRHPIHTAFELYLAGVVGVTEGIWRSLLLAVSAISQLLHTFMQLTVTGIIIGICFG